MMFRYQGVEFGGASDLIVRSFDPGQIELRYVDTPRPLKDGLIVGRDFLGGTTWAFDIVTDAESLGGALAASAALERAWKDPVVRAQANRPSPLSYELGGRWRRVYGRPGPYAGPNGDVLTVQGGARIVCDFRVTDPRHYDETEQHVHLAIVPATTGGLEAPLVAPLATVRSGEPRAGLVRNTGDAAAPLRVTFNGPVQDPWVRAAAGWEIGLLGTLAYDEQVTVDALLGTVERSDGQPAPGMLTRATRLTNSVLPPGDSELTFGGTDPTGTASVDLYWRNAHTTI